ncbi:hypothetical protein K8I85_07045, partial [bacterium]|nr:hypothetical protein [bacterium]
MGLIRRRRPTPCVALCLAVLFGTVPLVEQARAGSQRYGTDSRVVFQYGARSDLGPTEYVSQLHWFSVGTNGSVAVFGRVQDTNSSLRAQSLWYGPSNDLQLVARDDQPVPGFEASTPAAEIQNAMMSPDGSRLTFLTKESSGINRVWNRTGSITTLAIVDSLNHWHHTSVTDAGTMVLGWYNGWVSPSVLGLARGLPGSMSTVLTSSVSPPGFATNARFDLGGAVLATMAHGGMPRSTTRDGRVLFGADVWSGDYHQEPHLGRGLYLAGDGAVQRVAHAGDPAAGAPAGHTFKEFDFWLDRAG